MIRQLSIFKFSLVLGFLLQVPSANTMELSFCEDSWPPYTLGVEGNAPTGGYAVDFLNEIAKRTNIELSLHLVPWKRCLLLAKEGEFDGIMLLTKNTEREVYLEFTDPLMSDNNLIWFRSDHHLGESWKNWNSFKDLKPYKIGVVAGFNYGDKFNEEKKEFGLNVEIAPTIASNFQKLLLGRIDIFFVNLAAAKVANKDNLDAKLNLSKVDKLFEKTPFYIGLSKKSDARKLLPKFNQAIKGMLEDGTIDSILK